MESRTISLFAELPPSRRGPSAFLVSILLHVLAMGVLYLGLRHTVRVEDESELQRYTVRLLNLEKTEPQKQRSAAGGAAPLALHTGGQAAVSPGGSPASLPAIPKQLAQIRPAPQTLVQPNLPPNLLLPKKVPIPFVLLWSHESTPVKQLVPPPIQKITAADLRPSLEKPNQELKVADLKISATAFATKAPALPPSTTSPVVVHGPQPAKQVPQTAMPTLSSPTPAAVMSLSDIRMPEGTIALPAANETAQGASAIALLRAKAAGSGQGGNGNPASKQNGNGAGQGAGNQASAAGTGVGGSGLSGAGTGAGPGTGAGLNNGGNGGGDTGSGNGSGIGAGSGSGMSLTRLTEPKDGQFGIVVVGSSIAEKYPETVGLWGGRLAYTVYLHVGVAKSWILQYCMPRGAEAVTGSVTRPEAPWPYEMVRPNLAPEDLDADAIMVHGFVNMSGRFEKLAIVFPPTFTQAKFVLSALEQWRFRPALQNGQIATVEVLLIIPEQPE